ncbi:uncharacterized protein SETTUDRAFT_23123 [Exserohilum turcica Et28A]|uniref:Leucine-rich repeat-containing N-terminal plant-type domain-containing protein n=1 Tax=Exserohilum turcicum (strain 28A) TaxID=671987 RepID=R0JKN7_EXST2|nr:uncharacterized protein SETTUDRAFT_23123 [Exserohilum turcica Et28A]EOA81863.1 hypothetical protein SETTUDRAFT_23123 [Exserohilum turcica Et28A]
MSGLLALSQAAPAPGAHHGKKPPNNLERDLATARAFAKTVTGPPEVLANWTASSHVCEMAGFYCETNPDNVFALASIGFQGFHLTGNIRLDGLMNKMPDLAVFRANSNGFSGSVPSINNEKYLDEVDLSNNQCLCSFSWWELSTSSQEG